MRIERTEGAFGRSKQRAREEGTPSRTPTGQDHNEKDNHIADAITNGHAGPTDRHGTFAWQPFPQSPFVERLDWVCDIFSNFRGAGWNCRTSAIPPPPKWVQEQLRRNQGAVVPKHSYRVHSGQVKAHTSRKTLLIESTKTLLLGYLMLDGLKTAMMHDPYFWGITDRAPPAYLPSLRF